jgi:hypothetical protein
VQPLRRATSTIRRDDTFVRRTSCAPLALAILLGACSGGGSPSDDATVSPNVPAAPAPTPPTAQREWLDAEDLLTAGNPATTPIENRFYMPSGAAPPAKHELRGQLSVAEHPMSGGTPDSNYGQTGLLQFPGFSARFITVDDFLVPVERHILPRAGTRSHWRVILSPGRVWSESADGAWSRASFPFVLVSDTTNEAHNGLATFLFNDTTVSALQFQVIQETASWNRNDFWGRVPVEYTPGAVPEAPVVQADFEAEMAALTPLRAWSQLVSRDADARWGEFVRGLDSDDASATGIIANGIVYHQSCTTRLGEYPYCDFMRHGAYSLTKSMGAALTLLRLAQKYGDQVLELRIRDYVAVTASHEGWNDVRFVDVLNMATGVGDGNPNRFAIDPFSDENAVTLGAWSSVPSEYQKLDAVFRQGDYPWGPGEVFRYNTTQTFVLAVAMQNFLESREGSEARLWDMMRHEVLEPIGIRHAPMMHTAEASADGGVPLMGIGLYPTIDELTKISTLLRTGGRHAGVQLLSARGLDDALFRSGRGLPTGERNSAGAHLYHMSFWSLPHRTPGGCFHHIPYMEGYGGNYVVLMPNGLTAFRLADAEVYDVEALMEVAERIRPWCR